MPGLLPLDWDAKAGKLYLEVPLDGNAAHTRSQDLIWTNSTPWSMGSSELGGYGMDRGQVAPGVIVHFERTGPKLLLVQPNLDFRSSSSDRGGAGFGRGIVPDLGGGRDSRSMRRARTARCWWMRRSSS